MSFTIRELESLSGVKAHTIRIWEQRYNFLKPSRTLTNIRTYNNEELKTLLTVALLNKYGYKISRIDRMEPEQRAQAALLLPQQDAYYQNLVNDMIGHMVDLDHRAFELVLNNHIQQHGIEKTITLLIFGFMEKVGILWQTNRIVPVQEHIVSNIIRQKIVSAIESLPFVNKSEPLFLLLLPEDEHHEMGLLFVYYLLRKKGVPVIYLGANVPAKDVGYIMDVKQPSHLYIHLTSFPRQHNFQKYLQAVSDVAGDSHVIFSGWATQLYRKTPPSNVFFLKSFDEVISYISRLV